MLILTGARQAGKTTLLKHAFPDHAYVSLGATGETIPKRDQTDTAPPTSVRS